MAATACIILVCILAVCIPLLPRLIRLRVWILRKVHLFKLADWHERNMATLVTVFRGILAVAIFGLLLVLVRIIQ